MTDEQYRTISKQTLTIFLMQIICLAGILMLLGFEFFGR